MNWKGLFIASKCVANNGFSLLQLQQRLNAMSSCGEDGDRRELES